MHYEKRLVLKLKRGYSHQTRTAILKHENFLLLFSDTVYRRKVKFLKEIIDYDIYFASLFC